jgi:L,D-peptidoglycan transpeptidase YkuD (ErfK/YbiS/YcfS/YnhG family)
MIRVIRWVIIALASAGVLTVVIILMVRFTPRPPAGEMEYAMETLSRASRSKAGTYSARLFSEANAAFDSAMANWKKENKRFLYFRDYDKVKSFAIIASDKARQANDNSITNSTSLKFKVKDKIESVNKTAASIDGLFGRYPFPEETRNRISKGRMLLKEAEVAFNKGQYLPANRKITDAEYLLTSVYENATSELREYFKSFATWKRWTQSTISDSRKNNSYSIIVDKFSKKCYVYYGGVKKYEFEAELGRNWVGNKRKMGDKATPEGFYKIIHKYQGRETLYHKALALDYPNAEDKERFKKEISKGTIPSSSRIGDGIQIHGGGGKGVDWTEGCVALRDSEIDIVFNLIRVGTPVTIVGSMKDIDEILID